MLVFSILAATSFGIVVSAYWLHRAWVSSWSRRSSLTMPRSLNEAFIIACALARTAASDSPDDDEPAQPASTAMEAAAARMRVACMGGLRSALDRGGVVRGPVGVLRQERGERDRCIRGELELGEALLAEAI